MKRKKRRDVAAEIIADLKAIHATLKAGIPLRQKYSVRSGHSVPDPATYDAAAVGATRELVGVSQPVFARMLGVSAALVRSWESGQRKPAPIARRLLDQIRAPTLPLAPNGPSRMKHYHPQSGVNSPQIRELLSQSGKIIAYGDTWRYGRT